MVPVSAPIAWINFEAAQKTAVPILLAPEKKRRKQKKEEERKSKGNNERGK